MLVSLGLSYDTIYTLTKYIQQCLEAILVDAPATPMCRLDTWCRGGKEQPLGDRVRWVSKKDVGVGAA